MSLTIYKDTITNRNTKFEKLVLKTQEEMKKYVNTRLSNKGKVVSKDGYVFYKGTFPVLLCAHMDTVHKEIPKTLVYANGTLSSTQGIGGDDRCGIYMIFKILKKYDCSVVFLEDEEIGCVGARKFAMSNDCAELEKDGSLKYIIEFDRKGNNHAVTYDCDNKEFDEFITKEFFKKESGTCSDISYIAPALGVAAVNLSCGYYKEHHIEEWVNLAEMERVIVEAMKILKRTEELEKPFEYIESYKNYYHSRYWDYNYDNYDEYDYYSDRSTGYYTRYSSTKKSYRVRYKKNGALVVAIVSADTEIEAYYKFFQTYQTVCYADIIKVEKI